MKFHATAARGIAPLLARELQSLGAEQVQIRGNGVDFQGELEVGYRACLWSRLANRILLPVTSLSAVDEEQLYEGIKAIHWEKHLQSSGSLAVDCSVRKATISHSHYAALKTKDAIVDRMRERFGERPSVDTQTPDVRIHLVLRGNRAKVSIDLSGGSLHRRGYRIDGGHAPLKENLAAAILQQAGWPLEEGGNLIDPMCGSATLLIEAAFICADRAPALEREHFGFVGWKRHDAPLWQRLQQEARERLAAGLQNMPHFYGFDRDSRVIRAAQENIARAGLEEHIQVAQRRLDEGLPDEVLAPDGMLVVNPPYGERLGELNELRDAYLQLGRILRQQLPGWRAAVFTANAELVSSLGLVSRTVTELNNGPLDCKLFVYQVPQGKGGGEQGALSEGATMFANRLRKNLRHRAKWARREGVDCYRLYDADLPEYAFAIDLYQGEESYVMVQEYQPPKTVDAEQAAIRMAEVMAAVPEVLELRQEQVYFRHRRRQSGADQYEKLAGDGRFHEVREWNARLLVNFTDYLDTGLFLDHRLTRRYLQELAQGRSFLNLFAYTGAATVHAALGGASRTLTVDMSSTYLEWARRNMAINGFRGREHVFHRADCLQWLASESAWVKERYGLIFMDPPTFSNSKRMDETLDIQRDHAQLIEQAMQLLEEDGVLIFSNNYRRFKMDDAIVQKYAVKDITRGSIPEDFSRNARIHNCWELRWSNPESR